MNHLHGKFVWFEHLSGDAAKAGMFYNALFGWHTESMPMGDQIYSMIQNGTQGIGGYGAAPEGVAAGWMSYLSVPDVDVAYAAALAAGAKGRMAPANFGPVGRGATIVDPTGAVVSLWKSAEGDRADPVDTPDGDWLWNELWTPDDRAALSFYEHAFGFTHDSMDMGAQGAYYILKVGDKARAGLMKAQGNAAPPMWLPYVRVADCDAAAARAQSLGARAVAVAPTDIPKIGRFAVVVDPLGAAFAVMKPTWTA